MPLLLLLGLLLSPGLAHGEARPGQEWNTIRTEHFHVHYTPPQAAFAHAFATTLERALPALEKDLDWEPKTLVDIVVNDMSDTANGMAVSFPNTHIEVFPVPFDLDSSLAEYTNWVDLLAIHELTHIVANDTTTGAYKWLRKIFGSVIKPNGLQPDWLVEGLAVFEETRLTNAGRGRSALTEAILRASVREGLSNTSRYLTLDRLNQGPFWWPAGNTPYLIGYALQASIEGDSKRKEHSFPGQFSKENSSRIPFTPNFVLKDLEDYTWDDAWDRFSAKIRARYEKDPAEKPRCRLTSGGRFTGIPVLGKDGYLYFSFDHPNEGSTLARVRPDGPCDGSGVEILTHKEMLGTPSSVSVSADGRYVLYTDENLDAEGVLPYDIYAYDTVKNSVHRLTHGERVQDPAFLAEGYSFFAVRNNGDNTQSIVKVDWNPEDGSVHLAAVDGLTGKLFERLSNPFVAKDSLYFSRHDNHGHEEIMRAPLTGGKMVPAIASRPTNGYFFERTPAIDPVSGKLFYSANYNPFGGENTYSVYTIQNGQPMRVHSSPSGYLRSVLSLPTGEFVVNDYSSSGFDLYREARSLEKAALQKEDLHAYLSNGAKGSLENAKPISEAQEYNPLTTPAISMWPQYWIPVIATSYGGTLAGIQTSGNDPLNYHNYDISVLWDSRTTFPTYNVSYLNRMNRLFFRVGANQRNDYLSSLAQSNRQSLYSAEVFFPSSYWLFNAGTAFEERSYLGSRVRNGQIFQTTHYRDVTASPAAIAPNRGFDTSLRLVAHPASHFEPEFGEVNANFEGYVRGFHPAHSLLFGAHGGISSNRLLASNYFQGGGPSPLSTSPYVVHGYPIDTLLGQRITTVQAAYSFPIAHIYRGWNTNPIFIKSTGFRLVGDAGTSSFLGQYVDKGRFFTGYIGQKFGHYWIAGSGLDYLLTGTFLHHVPFELVLGYHHGFQARFGGNEIFFLGLTLGSLGG